MCKSNKNFLKFVCSLLGDLIFHLIIYKKVLYSQTELEAVSNLIKSEMENVVELPVPLIVDIGVGDNWYEAH